MTADTAHLVATGEETRQTLYVGVSRGRQANHIYLATGFDGDPHSLIDPKALRPPTAIDVLAEILGRDGSDRSATTTQREAASYATQLHDAVMRYHDALGFAAEEVLGADTLAERRPGRRGDLAGAHQPNRRTPLCAHIWRSVLWTVRTLSPRYSTPPAPRELGTSNDRAAVLDWRLGGSATEGPLPWLDSIPSRLAEHPTWGPYLRDRSDRITGSRCVGASAKPRPGRRPATPAWASGLTAGEHAVLRGDLSVWRAAFAVPEDDGRPTGPVQSGSSTTPHQQDLDRRAKAVLGVHRADEN